MMSLVSGLISEKKVHTLALISSIDIYYRTQNFRRNQQMSKISNQKRQILINNAFKKYYNIENLSQNQTVEILLNVNSLDNSPPPTT